MTITERFWKYVEVKGKGDCWPWLACKDTEGYGFFGLNGKNRIASRVAWQLTNGEIPQGKWVLHSCDNPSCVNPAHLYIGTAKNNTDEMMEKGRHVIFRGEEAPRAKLTEAQVKEMRERYASGEWRQQDLADHYGVSQVTVQNALTGTTWRHLPIPLEHPNSLHQVRGELQHSSKLTAAQVRAIRAALTTGRSGYSLAKEYNVRTSAIYAIRHGHTWRHLL